MRTELGDSIGSTLGLDQDIEIVMRLSSTG